VAVLQGNIGNCLGFHKKEERGFEPPGRVELPQPSFGSSAPDPPAKALKDSNLRDGHQQPGGYQLPHLISAAGRIRTCSPRLRRPMPYPLGHSGLLRCQDSNLNNGLQRTVCCRVTTHLISCPTWIRTRSHGLTVRWFAFNRQGINARTSADFAVVEWRSWFCDHNTGRARMAGVEPADVGFGDRVTTSRSSPFTTSGWEELNLHHWYPKPA
jgi:hypothetical protein